MPTLSQKQPQEPQNLSFRNPGGGSHIGATLLIGTVCVISVAAALNAMLSNDHMRADMCRYAMRQVIEIDAMMREDRHHVLPKGIKRGIVEWARQSEEYLVKNCPKDTKRSVTQPSAREILSQFLKSMAGQP